MLNVPDFGETCKAILDAVMDEMDAENCFLMLKDPVSGELPIRATRGKNEKKSIFTQANLVTEKDLNQENGSHQKSIRKRINIMFY